MISGLIGDIGSGKTMAMTAFGAMAYNTGVSIYANYPLKGIKYQHISAFEDFLQIKTPRNLILLDELWASADSRQSMSNLQATQWAAQSRKIGSVSTDVIWTGQMHKQLDLRIRELTQFWMEPSIAARDPKSGKPLALRINAKIYIGDKTIAKKFCLPMFLPLKGIRTYVADMYDTRQIVDRTENTSLKDEYADIIEKYRNTALKTTELRPLLIFDEEVPKEHAGLIASYIKALQGGAAC
jgi:hypothetical protein